jgi:catechol 2,3-dioxygenase-like lactoylglutathione lyase family enzyme
MQKSWCFHLSLNVANLARAIDFYRVVFDMEPAKCHDDYAKFEVVEPPVVFSLVPQAAGDARSRVGLALESPEQLQVLRDRLEARGIHIDQQGETFAVADPDGNTWQFAAGDDEATWNAPQSHQSMTPAIPRERGEPLVWEHHVNAETPNKIPHEDGSVDEIRLTGTFNIANSEGARGKLLGDAFRVLKPGGRVVAHGLAGDRPFPNGMPALPGLAAMVSHVPTHQSIAAALKNVGFVQLQFVKFGDKAWFEHDGVQMREIKAVAYKPLAAAPARRDVIYRGPFRQIRDDQGNLYPRGERTAVPAAAWTLLRQSPQAELFVFIEPDAAGNTCGVH